MSEHRATVHWTLGASADEFRKGRYSRAHSWSFDGGITVPASPSPSVVPAPYSEEAAIDPEEAYVASIASCHMLTFVHLASRAGFEVTSYQDHAVGTMARNERGGRWVSRVVLTPRITYGDSRPDVEEEQRLHHQAHEGCFIASSVKTEIVVVSAAPSAT